MSIWIEEITKLFWGYSSGLDVEKLSTITHPARTANNPTYAPTG
jgi:hypothetical protein